MNETFPARISLDVCFLSNIEASNKTIADD